jgi:predicted hotdog family 3-hydroxylacyl-ACP dehydratase
MQPPMLLLDEVVGWNRERIVAAVTVRPGALFLDEGALPAHIAIEWMAQTCGAMVGLLAIEKGQPVRIGFLLGTRNFAAQTSRFHLGDRVTVTARPVFDDGQMAVFDCEVERAAEICATARLNLFQPDDLQAMLEEQSLAMERK